MRAEQHAVAARRLAEPVDLLAQRQQLLTGLLEGVHQLRVTGRQGIDPGLELLYFARTWARAARVLQLFAQNGRFATELFQLGSIFVDSIGSWDSVITAPFPHRELVRRIPQRYRRMSHHVRSRNFDTLTTLLTSERVGLIERTVVTHKLLATGMAAAAIAGVAAGVTSVANSHADA